MRSWASASSGSGTAPIEAMKSRIAASLAPVPGRRSRRPPRRGPPARRPVRCARRPPADATARSRRGPRPASRTGTLTDATSSSRAGHGSRFAADRSAPSWVTIVSSGAASTTTSACATRASSDSTVASIKPRSKAYARAAGAGSNASTRAPRSRARRAIEPPIKPTPATPTVWLRICLRRAGRAAVCARLPDRRGGSRAVRDRC